MRSLPGWRGHGRRNGLVSLRIEDFPRLLISDGAEVVEADSLADIGRGGVFAVDLHRIIRRLWIAAHLEATPEADRLAKLEESLGADGPLGDAARELEADMASGRIDARQAAALLGVDEASIRGARIATAAAGLKDRIDGGE